MIRSSNRNSDILYIRTVKVAKMGAVTMEKGSIRGSCLCGAVAFEVQNPKVYRYCFCSLCRKIRGTRFAANVLVDPGDFSWTRGEASINRFDLPGTRFGNCFCSRCGTPMPRHTMSGRSVMVPAGVIEGDPDVRPDHVVFWDSRVSWLPGEAALEKYSETVP